LVMPQSLSSVHLHLVFSTRDRVCYFRDLEFREALHRYIGETSKRLGCPPIATGGVADHVHLLARFSRTVAIADWVKEVKRVSSVYVKERQPRFSWQAGYGVFAVDTEDLDRVATYVRTQEEHHRVVTFQEEFLRLLREHDLGWDERYLWD